jgi:hypothetical protein
MRLFAAIALLLSLIACGSTTPPSPPQQVITLPSGKQINVISTGKIMLGDTPAYQFRYATDLLVTWPATPAERSALIAQDEEIWTVIRPDVEKANLRAASIDAKHAVSTAGRAFAAATGGGVTGLGFGVTYRQGADGVWSRGFL